MAFPFAVLDFEASSLSPNSYPIEVGVAIAAGPDRPLSVWSRLIRPANAWLSSGDWDPAAEGMHGIAAASLAGGSQVREVAEALNRIIGPIRRVYCDGGYYDALWLEKLFGAAGIEKTFVLSDMAPVFVADRALFERFRRELDRTIPPHRAAADAVRLCSAMAQAAHDARTFQV